MLIEIFKTGYHQDSSSDKVWTEQDLDAIAAKYNPQEHEAPVVIGHPKDNAPAFGWVERLERRGNTLYAKLKDLVPEFVEAVKKGFYKKRSISLYPDMRLRHVGFLGAMPPAVKGLADIAFKEGEESYMTFEYKEDGQMTFMEKMKALFKEEGLEISPAAQQSSRAVEQSAVEFAEEIIKKKELEFAEAVRKKDEELARLRAETEAVKRQKEGQEFESFCEDLIKEGRLTPAQRETAKALYDGLSGTADFSEGKAVDGLKSLLASLPKQVELGEVATGDRTAKRQAVSRTEFAEMNPNEKRAFILEGGVVTE